MHKEINIKIFFKSALAKLYSGIQNRSMVLIIGEGLKQHLQVNKQGEGNEKTYSYISDSSVNKQKKTEKMFYNKRGQDLILANFWW